MHPPRAALLWPVVALVLLSVPAVRAQEAPTDRLGPCAADAEKHCSGGERGLLSLLRCLRKHEDELTPECQSAIGGRQDRARERLAAFRDACEAEIAQWCSETRAPRQLVRCVASHRDELSDTCREALPERSRTRAPSREPKPPADPGLPESPEEAAEPEPADESADPPGS